MSLEIWTDEDGLIILWCKECDRVVSSSVAYIELDIINGYASSHLKEKHGN